MGPCDARCNVTPNSRIITCATYHCRYTMHTVWPTLHNGPDVTSGSLWRVVHTGKNTQTLNDVIYAGINGTIRCNIHTSGNTDTLKLCPNVVDMTRNSGGTTIRRSADDVVPNEWLYPWFHRTGMSRVLCDWDQMLMPTTIESEIRPIFALLWFKMYCTYHNKMLHTPRQCNCRDMPKISLWSVEHISN